jgi:hypothetical protein
MSLLDASYSTDRSLLIQGVGITGDLLVEWRRTQRDHEVYFTGDAIGDTEIERQELIGGILLFSQTYLVPTTENTLLQRLRNKGVTPNNGEGLLGLFNYLLEEGAGLEGSEVEQHRKAALAFVECIKSNYPTLYVPLQFQYSQAVASIYRDRPRDIQRWADRGIFQLNALSQAVAMVRLTAVTGHTVSAPSQLISGVNRDMQTFQPISVFSAVSIGSRKSLSVYQSIQTKL